MPVLLTLAAVAAASVAAEPQSARFLNPNGIVTADDYPLVSLTREQEGRVTVRLRIDPTGLVTRCEIIQSSGHTALDEQTCALFRARARFEPARDAKGRYVADTYTQRVNWRIAGERAAPMPRNAWMVRSTMGFTREGLLVDCKVESTGAPLDSNDCEQVMEMVKQATGQAEEARAPGPIAGFSISETYFYPVPTETAADPPALPGATQLGRQVSEVVIDTDGRISNCRGIRYYGIARPEVDACALIRNQRFEAVPPGAKPLIGTVVVTAYLRTQSVT